MPNGLTPFGEAGQNGAAPLKKGVVKDDDIRYSGVAPSFIRCYFRSSRIDHQFDEKEITAPSVKG